MAEQEKCKTCESLKKEIKLSPWVDDCNFVGCSTHKRHRCPFVLCVDDWHTLPPEARTESKQLSSKERDDAARKKFFDENPELGAQLDDIAASKPVSASPRGETPTVEDAIRLIRKIEGCSGDDAKLILLKNWLLSHVISSAPPSATPDLTDQDWEMAGRANLNEAEGGSDEQKVNRTNDSDRGSGTVVDAEPLSPARGLPIHAQDSTVVTPASSPAQTERETSSHGSATEETLSPEHGPSKPEVAGSIPASPATCECGQDIFLDNACTDCWPGYNLCADKNCNHYRCEHNVKCGNSGCGCNEFKEGSSRRVITQQEFKMLRESWASSPAGMTAHCDYNAEELEAHPLSLDPYPPRLSKETEAEQLAGYFYRDHPEFWIHPLAASDVSGDKDRATIRVHKAMARYAALLRSQLEEAKEEGVRLEQRISDLDAQADKWADHATIAETALLEARREAKENYEAFSEQNTAHAQAIFRISSLETALAEARLDVKRLTDKLSDCGCCSTMLKELMAFTSCPEDQDVVEHVKRLLAPKPSADPPACDLRTLSREELIREIERLKLK
jgi:hypothetical protein